MLYVCMYMYTFNMYVYMYVYIRKKCMYAIIFDDAYLSQLRWWWRRRGRRVRSGPAPPRSIRPGRVGSHAPPARPLAARSHRGAGRNGRGSLPRRRFKERLDHHIHTYIHTYIHKHTAHINIHAYIHTYTYIHKHT